MYPTQPFPDIFIRIPEGLLLVIPFSIRGKAAILRKA
jgi:hypothetical protein